VIKMAVKANRCEACGKQLTDPKSIALGYGPECAQRVASANGAGATLAGRVDSVVAGASLDAEVQRWLRSYRRAFLARDAKCVATFEKAAIKAARAIAERRAAHEKQVQAAIDRLVAVVGTDKAGAPSVFPLIERFADAVRCGDEIGQEAYSEAAIQKAVWLNKPLQLVYVA
jgi:hypothetical protein